jgi:hypothetical protein
LLGTDKIAKSCELKCIRAKSTICKRRATTPARAERLSRSGVCISKY